MDKDKIKPSFDTNRQVLGKIFPLDAPFTVILDASERCNFRCEYCFRSSEDKSKWGYAKDNDLMSREMFKLAFSQLMEFPEPIRQISLSCHGEPLVNRDIPYMVRYMRERNYTGRISIHTNASLLDEDYAKDLATSGISRVVISIQGLTAEKYKEVSKANIDFEKLVRSIKVLYQERNSKDTEIDVKIADISLSKGEEEKFYDIFEPIADRVFVENIVPIWKDIDNKYQNEVMNKYGDKFPPQKCCPLIFHTLVVTPIGDIYPCTQLLCTHKLGNITKNTLKECWSGQMRKGLLRDILTLNIPDMCDGCYIRQNSIYTKEDMIDDYRGEILERLNEK